MAGGIPPGAALAKQEGQFVGPQHALSVLPLVEPNGDGSRAALMSHAAWLLKRGGFA